MALWSMAGYHLSLTWRFIVMASVKLSEAGRDLHGGRVQIETALTEPKNH